jgi:hypothetical protein
MNRFATLPAPSPAAWANYQNASDYSWQPGEKPLPFRYVVSPFEQSPPPYMYPPIKIITQHIDFYHY